MTHWTQVLSNVSLVEFVLLAVLTALQWIRHRIAGAQWMALAFLLFGGLSLTVKVDPSLDTHQYLAKAMVALLLLAPYCLFRFAATFRRPSTTVRTLAAGVTVAMIGFTFALSSLPSNGAPPPPHFIAYRVAFVADFAFLFAYVIVRLVVAARREPPIASARMHLLAVAVAGLQVQVIVVALGLKGPSVVLAAEALNVAIGILFLLALVFPSFVRVFLSRQEDEAFRRAVSELVSANDSLDVAERLLPHVCALVGASEAALLAGDGTVVARYPIWLDDEGADLWRRESSSTEAPDRPITVRTHSGTTHSLAVKISPYMPYFGTEELHKLEQLASMVGLAIERCEMAEQMAFQASHDGLTGLANRSLFMDRLHESLRHVGRRRGALAVLFIDLDRFKLVNDRVDHAAGDIVLNEMADRLTTMTRGVDVVARFGGDEFVAFGEVDNEAAALDMAERIRKGLSAPIAVGDARLVVTASIGVVVTNDSSAAPAMLLRDADNAMYDAKRSGRDQVALFGNKARDTANLKWGLDHTRAARLTAS